MLKSIAVLSFALWLGARPSSAQEVMIPDQLTLSQAVALALERNPSVLASFSDVDIAIADLSTAQLRPNPAVTVDSQGYPSGANPGPDFLGNRQFVLRADQEIEIGGRRGLRIRAADAAVAAAQARFDDARRSLTLAVQRAYFQAVLATADRDVARASLEEIDQAIGLNRSRFEQGEISGGDLRRLQVERLRFVDDVFAAELALRNARSALLALMSAGDLRQTFTVTEPLAANPAPASPTAPGIVAAVLPGGNIGARAPSLIAEALTRRPDVLAAQRQLSRADTETRLQRALRTPNPTIGAGYTRNGGSNMLVLGVTMPLPFSARNQGGVARADAERQQEERRVRAAELAVRLDVQQAANAVDVNQERVQYIEREYLTTARQSRDIVLASYQLGAADLIDYLDAQRAFRDTVRTYNRALYEQRVSIFELAAATALPSVQP